MIATITLLVKIGKEEHIRDLYENGTVYLNPLSYFRQLEDQQLRGDIDEGTITKRDLKNPTVKFSFIDRELKAANFKVREFISTGNLYSLYAISSIGFPNPEEFEFDKRNLEFGTHCILIQHPGIFISRVEAELKRLGYSFKHGFVQYYQNQMALDNLTPFHKPESFDYQKEFRFFIKNTLDEPIVFQIGSLKDCSKVLKVDDLMSLKLKAIQ